MSIGSAGPAVAGEVLNFGHLQYLAQMEHDVLLGTHVSTSGGIHTAFERGRSIGCTTMQIFTKNSNRWNAKPLSPDEVRQCAAAGSQWDIRPVFAHAAYLINLCATNPSVLKNSRAALIDELGRCELLGLRGLILHPGAHLGRGEEEGIRLIAESINHSHAATPGYATLTILESTAGQGTAIGFRFSHLRSIIDRVEQRSRMAVCLDTCHLFAAGYPIGTESGWDETLKEFDATVGLDRLIAVHVNDSRRECGSRVDRHEHIGMGKIGLASFTFLMNDPRLQPIPKILETEKSEDMHEDVENMTVLRSLIRKTGVAPRER